MAVFWRAGARLPGRFVCWPGDTELFASFRIRQPVGLAMLDEISQCSAGDTWPTLCQRTVTYLLIHVLGHNMLRVCNSIP
jgi:hypothetical protein